MTKVSYTCDWCGKIKMVSPSRARGKKFRACSKECRQHLLSRNASSITKEYWANLSVDEREEICAKMSESHMGKEPTGYYLSEYNRKLRPERVARMVETMSRPSGEITPQNRYALKGRQGRNPTKQGGAYLSTGICTILAAHHEMLKDDDKRLSTEFLEGLIGVKCKCRVNRDVSKDAGQAKEG